MLVFDEFPVNEDDGSVNMWFHQGEEVVTVAITDRHSDFASDSEDEPVNAVDVLWNEDDLLEVAMSCTRALGTMGKTKLLAALMRAVADEVETALAR